MEKKQSLPRYKEIEGILFCEGFNDRDVKLALAYEPRPGDVVVATYPKCGTTWMCQIVMLLQNIDKMPLDKETYFKRHKFLELCGAASTDSMERPGCVKTHLPFDRLKYSPDAKYIWIVRHPRDCVVSFYHHTRRIPFMHFSDGCFDDFFDLFVRGEVEYGDYFDHLLSWYEHRHLPNIFWTAFESMKKDLRSTIIDVAEFLEKGSSKKLLDDGERLLNDVIRYSSFEHMKQETNSFYKESPRNRIMADLKDLEEVERLEKLLEEAEEAGHRPVGELVRKGMVGEGRLVLTEEQESRLQARIREKTRGTDVMALFDEMIPHLP